MIARAFLAVFVVIASILVSPPESRAADGYSVYRMDASHTSVVFGIGHNNMSFVYGFFRKSQGSYSLDASNPANCRFQFAVDVNSIDTNQPARDKHLQTSEFFDAARFPQITFKSTSCQLNRTPEGAIVYYVTGELTIHGVPRQVTLPLQMLADDVGVKEDGTKDRRTAFLCQYKLNRSDYEMNTIPIVGNAVSITISFEGVQQPPQQEAATARR